MSNNAAANFSQRSSQSDRTSTNSRGRGRNNGRGRGGNRGGRSNSYRGGSTTGQQRCFEVLLKQQQHEEYHPLEDERSYIVSELAAAAAFVWKMDDYSGDDWGSGAEDDKKAYYDSCEEYDGYNDSYQSMSSSVEILEYQSISSPVETSTEPHRLPTCGVHTT
ncbi:hypothetical protein RND71_019571 [Anisodus tanguticus]|uniref:Uncharacterized protein n=1 Tax=Anisodus tanguticus TaxID=243964 RepID=A0AAE1S0G2_9SOLA|nr:hypothetical protein RND71_019571 [Anisodus tanguticus]